MIHANSAMAAAAAAIYQNLQLSSTSSSGDHLSQNNPTALPSPGGSTNSSLFLLPGVLNSANGASNKAADKQRVFLNYSEILASLGASPSPSGISSNLGGSSSVSSAIQVEPPKLTSSRNRRSFHFKERPDVDQLARDLEQREIAMNSVCDKGKNH